MKKIRFISILVFVTVCMFVLASCSAPSLSAPAGLYVDEDELTLHWNAVEYAQGYVVDLGGKTVELRKTVLKYSLTALSAGEYSLRVKAVGDEENFSDSAWSEPLNFVKEQENGLSYQLINNSTEYEVVSYGTASGNVEIPATFRGKPVTSIAANAFANTNRLTSLVIGENVTAIGERAFYNCSYLESITIPQSVQSIGAKAFQSCRSLVSITIPDGVKTIEEYTFSYCRSLESVTIGKGVEYIAQYAFSDCSGLKAIEIPDSVTVIEQYAFANNSVAKSLVIGNGVRHIAESAFYRNTLLESATFGSSVEYIGVRAFSECSSLTSVKLPDSVRLIDNDAFKDCTNLASVTWGKAVEGIGAYVFDGTKLWADADGLVTANNWIIYNKDHDATEITIPDGTLGIASYAFYESNKIVTMIIPDSVKYVNNGAFYACKSLTGVLLGDGVVSVGIAAFQGCELLSTAVFGSSLQSIGAYAFAGCRRITEVDLPDTVTSIGQRAFYNTSLPVVSGAIYADNWLVDYQSGSNVTKLTVREGTVGIAEFAFCPGSTVSLESVTLPEGLTYLGRAAFYMCAYLKNVYIPDSITAIEEYTFFRNTSLQSVRMPSTLTYIERDAFYECSSLISLTFDAEPEKLLYIGVNAFKGCKALTVFDLLNVEIIDEGAFNGCEAFTQIVIPDSVILIGDYAFSDCKNVESLTLGAKVEYIGQRAFNGLNKITSVTIPDSVKTIGNYAFYNCTEVAELDLGSGVVSIGTHAFYGMDKLTRLVIPASVKSIGAQAFRNCKALTSVIVGANVETIGDHAFYGGSFITIYCEADSVAKYWSKYWNSFNRPVMWGCDVSQDNSYVISFTRTKTSILNYNANNGISAPDREGYAFGGWTTVAGGTTAEYTAANVYTAPSDTVLYAIWIVE